MRSYQYLLDIALILLTTKVFGLLTRRLQMPQVVGALLAGILFGPTCLNILHASDLLAQLAEIGVITMMFNAGIGTSIKELKHTGVTGGCVAAFGVLMPLVMGIGFGLIFNRGVMADGGNQLLQNIFLGTVLTATSVSITVEALREMGKLTTQVGSTILAAALIDDILGLICLTIVSSLGGSAASVWAVLLKIVLFFLFATVVAVLVQKGMTWYGNRLHNANLCRFSVVAFAFCLLMAYIAEHFFGVADIIGAFVAGLAIGNTSKATYIESRVQPLSYLLLTPIFFANIGISLKMPEMNLTIFAATVVFLLIAIISKIVGCGIGAKLTGMKLSQSVQVGLGMVCRGEVALIVADKGQAMGMLPSAFLSPIVIMIVFTSVATPILLKIAFLAEDGDHGLQESTLVERYEAMDNLDKINQNLLRSDQELRKKSSK